MSQSDCIFARDNHDDDDVYDPDADDRCIFCGRMDIDCVCYPEDDSASDDLGFDDLRERARNPYYDYVPVEDDGTIEPFDFPFKPPFERWNASSHDDTLHPLEREPTKAIVLRERDKRQKSFERLVRGTCQSVPDGATRRRFKGKRRHVKPIDDRQRGKLDHITSHDDWTLARHIDDEDFCCRLFERAKSHLNFPEQISKYEEFYTGEEYGISSWWRVDSSTRTSNETKEEILFERYESWIREREHTATKHLDCTWCGRTEDFCKCDDWARDDRYRALVIEFDNYVLSETREECLERFVTEQLALLELLLERGELRTRTITMRNGKHETFTGDEIRREMSRRQALRRDFWAHHRTMEEKELEAQLAAEERHLNHLERRSFRNNREASRYCST